MAVIFEGRYSEIKIAQIERKMERQFHAKLQVHCFSQESFSAKNGLIQEIKKEGIFLIKPEAFSLY